MHSGGRGAKLQNKLPGEFFRSAVYIFLVAWLFSSSPALGQKSFEKRHVSGVEITISGTPTESAEAEQLRAVAADTIGSEYSVVKVRESIEALHDTGRVVSVIVSAKEDGPQSVVVQYLVKLQTQADKVNIEIGNTTGTSVKEQDLLFKLSLMNPGTAINDQALRDNANIILEYLRDLGYYNADVSFTTRPLTAQNRVGVTFHVNPNVQAKVQDFKINIAGYDSSKLLSEIKLKAGEDYTRDALLSDVEKIKSALRKDDFLAPELEEPRRELDTEKNLISIEINGKAGPKVNVVVDTKREKVGSSTLTKLLPVKRDGTLDYSAIVEGERRLEGFYQEKGYFFADVTPVCSVTPPLTPAEGGGAANETEFLCSTLTDTELVGKTVELKYKVDLNRRFTLSEIRLTGTNELTVDDIKSVLGTQTPNILGWIPYLGYGRGYTSETILEEDVSTIKSLMRELGYRDAQVRVNRGVSPTADNLIITFVVEEGPPTVVNSVDVTGNIEVPKDTLLDQ